MDVPYKRCKKLCVFEFIVLDWMKHIYRNIENEPVIKTKLIVK